MNKNFHFNDILSMLLNKLCWYTLQVATVSHGLNGLFILNSAYYENNLSKVPAKCHINLMVDLTCIKVNQLTTPLASKNSSLH